MVCSRGKTILVTGGAGYVGSVLVPKLLALRYFVVVVDLMVFGEDTLPLGHERLKVVKGNVCDLDLMRPLMSEADVVIHLAFVTDDSVHAQLECHYDATNFDAVAGLASIASESNVGRFVFASSTSVYGQIPEGAIVDEESLVKPIDGYGFFKRKCEEALLALNSPNLEIVVVRPSTVSGVSPRQRFDLLVNRMVNQSFHDGIIRVANPSKVRPGITIEDLTDFYVILLDAESDKVSGEVFNLSYENRRVEDIAMGVADCLGGDVELEVYANRDARSYAICSGKVLDRLGFEAKYSFVDSVHDLIEQLRLGKFVDPLNNTLYFNRLIQ